MTWAMIPISVLEWSTNEFVALNLLYYFCVAYILKQQSYVGLTFKSASSKFMNAFHSNFHITNCDHLETFSN